MLAEVASRLKGSCPAFRVVGGAADYQALQNQAPPVAQLPAAYVIPLAERADGNDLATGGIRQRVASHFGLLLAVTGISADPRGEHALFAIAEPRRQVRAALLGWTPDAILFDPITFSGADLVALEGPVMWWQEGFRFSYMLRSRP